MLIALPLRAERVVGKHAHDGRDVVAAGTAEVKRGRHGIVG
jgi:hypothetical protein